MEIRELNESIVEIKKQIGDLENTIFTMNHKIDRLLELLETDCKKMTNHIDFVENVYEKVKSPFTYIMDNVSTIIYAQKTITNDVPLLQDMNIELDEDDV